MRTIEVNLYTFAELSDKAKEKAREWYRGCIETSEYAEPVTDDAKDYLALLGYSNIEIEWSGFWSRGDGACFSATWTASAVNAQALREFAPQDVKLHAAADTLAKLAAKYPDGSATVKQSGHYYHEHCTDFEFNEFGQYAESDKVQRAAIVIDEKEFTETSRELMRKIYRDLETAHDYAHSDEAVDETIAANEYEFTADGSRRDG